MGRGKHSVRADKLQHAGSAAPCIHLTNTQIAYSHARMCIQAGLRMRVSETTTGSDTKMKPVPDIDFNQPGGLHPYGGVRDLKDDRQDLHDLKDRK